MAFLEVQNISKSHGPIRAVHEMSFAIERGEIFALFGPDGAGKTTLIRVLCHLMDADSGETYLEGRAIFRDFEPVKQVLGYMPQSFSLYLDLSVEENLTFYAGIYGLIGEAFRKKRDYLYTFSNLGPFASRRAGALSGGMKQKLALSCALIHDPNILILDEPTTGVDPLSRRQFWEMLLVLKQQGVTVLVTTPYMDEVLRADRAAFMFAGRKLSEGTPQALAREFRGSIYYLEHLPNREILRRMSQIQGLTPRRFGAGFHLHLAEETTIEQLGPQLREAGVDTSLLTRIEPQLEDRFIQLMETGS